MGADTFFVKASGRTAREAFAEATSQALYESGHGGYSGTIAEKHSFVEIFIPPVTSDSYEFVRAYAEKLIDEDDSRVSDKWGPAGCIKIRDLKGGKKEFLFFGWASS